MPDMIRDGAGHGYLAKVSENQRLYTRSISSTDHQHSTELGDAYQLNTGIITLGSDANTPVIYLKNNASTPFILTQLALGLGPTTGGSGGIPIARGTRNPTGGTIVSNAVNVEINNNRNFSSPKELTADVFQGATGDTMTGGDPHMIVFNNPSGRIFIGLQEVLGTGASFGVSFQPQAGNTSMDIYVVLVGALSDPKG